MTLPLTPVSAGSLTLTGTAASAGLRFGTLEPSTYFSPGITNFVVSVGSLAGNVGTSTSSYGLLVEQEFTPTQTTIKSGIAMRGQADLAGNGSLLTSTLSGLIGVEGTVRLAPSASGTLAITAAGLFRFFNHSTSGVTVTQACGILVDDTDVAVGATGTISEMYGIYVVGMHDGTSKNVGIRVDAGSGENALIWFANNTTSTAGGVVWGSAFDIHLYREATTALRTDAQFTADWGICTKTKAGTPTDADLKVAKDGAIIVDTAANKIWVRTGGAWKSVAVA